MINLLPPQQKKELLERKNQKMIIILGFLLSLFFLSLILGLLSTKFYLSGQNLFQKTVSDITRRELENEKNQEIKEEILGLNKALARLSSFYQENIRLTDVLEKIILGLPEGLYLDTFSYQKDNLSLQLTGMAQTRENLILFKNNLEEEPRFSEISFPPSNWVKAKDIDFFVNLKYSLEK